MTKRSQYAALHKEAILLVCDSLPTTTNLTFSERRLSGHFKPTLYKRDTYHQDVADAVKT